MASATPGARRRIVHLNNAPFYESLVHRVLSSLRLVGILESEEPKTFGTFLVENNLHICNLPEHTEYLSQVGLTHSEWNVTDV